MKTKILLSVFALFLTSAMFAQKPVITFTETAHDFGVVSEEDEKVSYNFEFTNTGNADLVLTNVQASCGCTTPQWPKEPIAAGKKGIIQVTYSAGGRPGSFLKTITVTSNADKQELTIRGTVTPRGQAIETTYPVQMGDIRTTNANLSFGDVPAGESRNVKFPVANSSNKDITIQFVGLPAYITAESKALKAGAKDNITLTFNAAKTKDWGHVNTDIFFITNGSAKNKLKTTANISEKFTAEQKANPPVATLETTLNAGTITAGTKKSVELKIQNTGKAPLFIRKAAGNAEVTATAPKGAIAPNKTGTAKIEINAAKLAPGTYTKAVTLVTNDPSATTKMVNVTYTVEAKK